MSKDDMMFDWRDGEGHAGRNFVSWVLVGLLAMVMVGLVDVKLETGKVVKSASAEVLFFSDETMRMHWMMKAVEDGPFPGGLRFAKGDDANGLEDEGAWSDSEKWSGHEIEMRSLVEDRNGGMRVMERGGRYFPERKPTKSGGMSVERVATRRIPLISAYEKEAAAWLPKDLPKFEADGVEYSSSGVWRFLLQLRNDGSVEHCMPLSGGEGEVQTLVSWLEGVRFAKSDEEVRWMGLRVEFLNVSGDGSDTK